MKLKIGIIDVDGHNWPNLALMKISAWHKAQGDSVSWCWTPLEHFDIVYQSKILDATYSKDIEWLPHADKIIKGGTGYDIKTVLPDEIEHTYPDYSLYWDIVPKLRNTAYGFLTRGCPRNCEFCIVSKKEGLCSRQVADLDEFWRNLTNIKLLDPNLLACRDREKLLDQLIDSRAMVDFTQGLDIRFMDKYIANQLNLIRVKRLHFAWDDPKQDLRPQFEMFNKWYKRKDPSRKIVYVLTNFNSSLEEDLYRIYELKRLGYNPDVRIFDKPHAPKEILRLQGWCNNRIIFGSCERFEDYKR